jgi:hypothetical protein
LYLTTNLGLLGANATEAGGTGDQFTGLPAVALTSAYDAAKTAASQTSVDAAKSLLDRIIVPAAGTSSGSPTGTEVFEYGAVRMTSTVDDDGNRTAVEWSAVE